MKDGFMRAASLLPPSLRAAAEALPSSMRSAAEELRLRAGHAPTVLLPEGERPLPGAGPVTEGMLRDLLEIATGASAHAAADSLRRGFVTAAGGCRVGFCGQAVTENGAIRTLGRLSSAAVRIPRQHRGCADGVFPILHRGGRTASALLISPPGGGKTTLLRELVRRVSEAGERVALADERGEVAGMGDGGFDLGPATDVLTGASKSESAMLLLRAMNPQLLALDEITAASDVEAVAQAAGCGVRLLATAHGEDAADLRRRGLYRQLLELGVFSWAVVIRRRPDGRREMDVEALS